METVFAVVVGGVLMLAAAAHQFYVWSAESSRQRTQDAVRSAAQEEYKRKYGVYP